MLGSGSKPRMQSNLFLSKSQPRRKLYFMPHIKLFSPGPIEVSEKTMRAFSKPMIGHRSKDFQALYADIHLGAAEALATPNSRFLSAPVQPGA